MKKFLISLAVLLFIFFLSTKFGNKYELPTQNGRIQASIDKMAHEYALNHGCNGRINEDGCVKDSSSSTAATSSSSSSSFEAEPEKEWHEVVLVDQNFAHVGDNTGIERLRAMQTKVLKGTLEEAHLTFYLDRGSNDKSFSAVAMYQMPYNDGVAQSGLEWKRFRFVDAQWVGNCNRNLSPKSGLTTLGVQNIQATYDLSAFPTTPEDACSTEGLVHDFVNAFNSTDPDVDFAFGFMPSDLNANLKVTLDYVGDLEITDF